MRNEMKYPHDWVYDNRGILTCRLRIHGQLYRAKSEVLILNEDETEVFLAFKKNGYDYKVPGGGWDKNDVDDVETVIREALEEAHIRIKDIKYVTSYTGRYTEKSRGEWIGPFVKLYVGKYDGKVDYHTAKEDEDKTIKKRGQFYEIKKIYDRLSAVHQEALAPYLKDRKIRI